jgi:hypothetical protein
MAVKAAQQVNMKAILYGLSLFAGMQVVYLSALNLARALPASFVWFPYIAALLGGFLAGVLSRQTELGHFALLGIAMAAMMGLLNMVWSVVGLPSDFHGRSSSFLVATLSLPLLVILSVFGGTLGAKLKRSF